MELVENIILLLVGLSVFMVGMDMMSTGMKKAAGKSLKGLFKRIQNKRFACFGIGAAVTALIQSSSATSGMVIGFINAGIMTIFQGLCIMMGAYIGTSVTGLIVSLSSFKITPFLIGLAFIGLVLMLFFKNQKVKTAGNLICGLGILFFGLETMSGVFSDGSEVKTFFENLFVTIEHPLLLMAIGAVFTAIIQSSSATSGIVIMLVNQQAIPMTSGLYLVIGATIGAVVVTIIASLSGSVNSKRLAATCIFMRACTGIAGTCLLWLIDSIWPEGMSSLLMTAFGNAGLAVAMFNLLFNAVFMMICLPFAQLFAKFGMAVIKDKEAIAKKRSVSYIDDKMLGEPSVAKMQAKKEILGMMDLAFANLKRGYLRVLTQNSEEDQVIIDTEDRIDNINEQLTSYLIKLSAKLEGDDGERVGSWFHVINDVERIGDHANNFYEMSVQMQEQDLTFSRIAEKEFGEMFEKIEKMCSMVPEIFDRKDQSKLHELHELETETDELNRSLSTAHYNRIKNQECKVELSPFYTTLISNLERVADHLVNIGYSIVDPVGDDLEDDD